MIDEEDDPDPFGDEARLLEQLLSGYVSATRPVANASHKIIVKLGFTLTQILNMVWLCAFFNNYLIQVQ